MAKYLHGQRYRQTTPSFCRCGIEHGREIDVVILQQVWDLFSVALAEESPRVKVM